MPQTDLKSYRHGRCADYAQDDHRFRCEGDHLFHGMTATCRSEATRAFVVYFEGVGGVNFARRLRMDSPFKLMR